MVDTARLLTDLQTLLADNTSHAISAQDLRDFLVSAVPAGRAGSRYVVASTASAFEQSQADYVCDGTADEVQIQAAIDELTTYGGVVYLGPGTFTVANPIVIKNIVGLLGSGKYATSIKLADSTAFTSIKTVNGVDVYDGVIETDDLSTHLDSNNWFVDTENVPYGFKIADLEIDGNDTGSAVCNGLTIFGKGYDIDNVRIKDCNQVDFYSECGSQTGQNDDRDEPETTIHNLSVRDAGSHNILFRGPHDAHFTGKLISNGAGTDNLRIEEQASKHNGKCNIDNVHVYGEAGGWGIWSNARAHITFAEVESATSGAIHIEDNRTTITECDISGAGADGIEIVGDLMRVQGGITSYATAEVVRVTGDLNKVDMTLSFNNDSNITDQVVVDGNGNHVYIRIDNGAATNAQLKLVANLAQNRVVITGNALSGVILDIEDTSGGRNDIITNMFKGAGATDWDQAGEATTDNIMYTTSGLRVVQEPS